MQNEVSVIVSAEDQTRQAFRSAQQGAEQTGSKFDKLRDKTDHLGSQAETSAGAFGALQSGIDLSRMKAEAHAESIQKEADALQDAADAVKEEAEAAIDAAKEKADAAKKAADEQFELTTKNIDSRLKEAEKKAEADGNITDSEKKKLDALKESSEIQKEKAKDTRDGLKESADKQVDDAQKAAEAQIKAAQDAADAKQEEADKAMEAATEQSTLTTALLAGALATDALTGVTDLMTVVMNSSILAKIKDTAATVIHAAKSAIATAATYVWAQAQAALNFVMAMNPIGLVVIAIVALIAVIVLIATKTDWFQKIWKVAWEGIKNRASEAWNFIKKAAELFVTYIGGLPGKISKATTGMWDGIKNAFRSALNWVIDKWNGLNFPGISVAGIQVVPGFGTPDIKHFATGGIGSGLAVVGEHGRELVNLGAGSKVFSNPDSERMLSSNSGNPYSGMTPLLLGSDGSLLGNLLIELLSATIIAKGGRGSVIGIKTLS